MMNAARPLDGLRALVVEDEILIAEELRERLLRLGLADVWLADTGEGAIMAAADHRPHFILMDIRLKGRMDGIEAAVAIRGRAEVPVIFLTAHSDQDTLHRALKSDPFGYVMKPLNERDLVVTIELSLHKFELESRLRESEQRYAATLASIGDGVIATDLEGRVTFMNAVAENLTGWQRDLARGRAADDVMQIIAEVSGSRCEMPLTEALRTRQTVHLTQDTLLVTRDGTRIPIDDSAAPVIGEQGELMGAVVAFRDIRPRRATEKALDEANAQLRQAQKLEAIGRLAGGIAHDFNNFLTVINGSADLALDDDRLDNSTRHLLDIIKDTGRRATALTRQLLTFGLREAQHVTTVQLNDLLDRTSDLLKRVLPPSVELVLDFDPWAWPVPGDPVKIEQIIMNLAINARDAMPDGGQLTFALENCTLDALSVQAAPGVAPGRFVLLMVTDTGCGMDAPTRQRIFEPFFTTKPRGEGTGLGLATVYGILGQMNGFITVTSEPGRGSTFRLYLPAEPSASMASDVDEESLAGLRTAGDETLLLVVADQEVRAEVSTTLERQGYTVLSAATGEEALRTMARNAQPVHLLMTDLVLPGMGGRALIEVARASDPGIKILLFAEVCDTRDLVTRVREALDDQSPLPPL